MSFLSGEVEYFIRIAEAKSLLQAADYLGITQPALSRALDRLESKLGFDLLERSRSGIKLTEKGRLFLSGLNEVHDNLSSLVESVREESAEIVGKIKLVGHQSVLQDFFIPHYSGFRTLFPKLRFNIEAHTSRRALEEVHQGRADLGLIVNPIEYNGLVMRTLSQPKALFYGDWKKEDAVFVNPQMIDLAKLLKSLKKHKIDEKNIQFLENYDLIAEIVSRGHGCGLLPDHVAKRFHLKENESVSSYFQISYQLKLVFSQAGQTEKVKLVSRKLEEILRQK